MSTNSYSKSLANINQRDIAKHLNFCNPKFLLLPFDIIAVGSSIGYEVQRQVKGEVLYPGMYTILNKDERVSDLISRAGGLTVLAYVKGASLKREGPSKVNGKNAINQNEVEQNKIAQLQRLKENVNDTLATMAKEEILKNVYVGIELEKILENLGKQTDLILEEGDVLRIPKQLQMVKVNGEVLYPVITIFNQGSGVKHYISQGGGFFNKCLKRRSYIIYANGSVKSTSKIFFFNNYPSIESGAELFIPMKDEGRKLSSQEVLGMTTGIASLGAIILGILNLTK